MFHAPALQSVLRHQSDEQGERKLHQHGSRQRPPYAGVVEVHLGAEGIGARKGDGEHYPKNCRREVHDGAHNQAKAKQHQ